MAKRGRPSKLELAARAAVQAGAPVPVELGPAAAAQPEAPEIAAAGLGATIEALRVPGDPPQPPVMPPAPPAPPEPVEQDLDAMPACDREDPRKLHGKALREFAHRRGIARSEMEGWTDEKVREQAKIVAYRQYGYGFFAEV